MPENETNPLPSPEDCPDADVVIFDGECAFCQGPGASPAGVGRSRATGVSVAA